MSDLVETIRREAGAEIQALEDKLSAARAHITAMERDAVQHTARIDALETALRGMLTDYDPGCQPNSHEGLRSSTSESNARKLLQEVAGEGGGDGDESI